MRAAAKLPNSAAHAAHAAARDDQPHDAWSWPDQRFTMQHGPWAGDQAFLAHLAAAVVLAVALRGEPRRSPAT